MQQFDALTEEFVDTLEPRRGGNKLGLTIVVTYSDGAGIYFKSSKVHVLLSRAEASQIAGIISSLGIDSSCAFDSNSNFFKMYLGTNQKVGGGGGGGEGGGKGREKSVLLFGSLI